MKRSLQSLLLLLAVAGLFAACGSDNKAQEAETGDAQEVKSDDAAKADAATYNVTEGTIMWTGEKPLKYSHNGTVQVSEGKLMVADGNIVGGAFTIDMNTIDNKDLEEKPEKKADLENHLMSGDFFEVESYPTSTFEITKVEPVAEEGGDATHMITGNLTMRGIPKSITFPANVIINGDMITAVTPKFSINRTNWGVNYNASILDVAKDALISDDIALVIDLKAKK